MPLGKNRMNEEEIKRRIRKENRVGEYRERGLSYKDIGLIMGFSREKAAKMYKSYLERKREKGN